MSVQHFVMDPIIGVSAALLLTGTIFYNAFVSYCWHQDHRGEELLAESSNWYGTFFYANGNDPRLFVPKRSGGGYTVNFGKPFAVLLILSSLVALAVYLMS